MDPESDMKGLVMKLFPKSLFAGCLLLGSSVALAAESDAETLWFGGDIPGYAEIHTVSSRATLMDLVGGGPNEVWTFDAQTNMDTMDIVVTGGTLIHANGSFWIPYRLSLYNGLTEVDNAQVLATPQIVEELGIVNTHVGGDALPQIERRTIVMNPVGSRDYRFGRYVAAIDVVVTGH